MDQEFKTSGIIVQKEHATVMSVKDWMLTLFLCMIPIVNIVMLFIWAFSESTNLNKRNYSRASLLLTAIVLGLYLLFAFLFLVVFGAALNMDV